MMFDDVSLPSTLLLWVDEYKKMLQLGVVARLMLQICYAFTLGLILLYPGSRNSNSFQ